MAHGRLQPWRLTPPPAAHQATSGICYRTLQYADSQVNKLEITPDKHYLAGAPAQLKLLTLPYDGWLTPLLALQLRATRPSGCLR